MNLSHRERKQSKRKARAELYAPKVEEVKEAKVEVEAPKPKAKKKKKKSED